MSKLILTLKNPSKNVLEFLGFTPIVYYVSHKIIDKPNNEYLFQLKGINGAEYSTEGILNELFIEDFTQELSKYYLKTDSKCPDVAVTHEYIHKGAEYTLKTQEPSLVQYGITDDQGKEHVSPVYLLTERAYKYMLSKCTEDELWDLGFRGCNPDHIKTVKSPLLFKDVISNHKA